MKKDFFSLMFVLVLYLSQPIYTMHLKPKQKLNEIYEHNSSIGIRRIVNRIENLHEDTSCKVAAKFMLLTLANVKSDKDRLHMSLTHNNEIDILNMIELLRKGYVLQVEIKTNHHFVIFQKNEKELYLLQAFYSFYQLKEWMSYPKMIMRIDEFFDKFRIILSNNVDINQKDRYILDLFYPDYINKGNKILIQKMLDYFHLNPTVDLINVDYVKYNFNVKQIGYEFDQFFKYVDTHFVMF
jgi:hypothetical protein